MALVKPGLANSSSLKKDMNESGKTQLKVKTRRERSLIDLDDQTSCAKVGLTRGRWALVDVDDVSKVSGYAWQYSCAEKGYAWRVQNKRYGETGKTKIRMHHVILGGLPEKGFVVDHINGDTLDNRKSNLRICTQADNQHNRRKNSGSQTSKYKGVHLTKRVKKPWTAQIGISGRTQYIGIFETAEDAARAYDRRAMLAFGPYALLNFPIKRLKQA